MNARQTFFKIVVFSSVMLLMSGAVQIPQPAWASMEDAAIFYEELDQHGEWVEYGNYGPVWYPTQVQENWRPYVDGRWTPADEGYVFETQEPWGWATYHYGNWMPTEEYGWVWVPGRTWYPNTVAWRTSPESQSPDESYIGWAPIPPPNYTPQPGYYPEGYYGGGPYGGPFENLITAPFWIFVKAASFLLGFSEPYAPSYSYWGCGCLTPPPVVPYYYNRTVVVHNYYTPNYYPRGYWAGRGYYNWGPPLPYVSRVTRIKQVNINNYVRQVNIYQRRNVAPPPGLVARRSYFRQVLPPAMVKHHPLPRGERVRDVHMARANLVRPHLVKASMVKNVPAIRAHLPKTRVTRGEGQWRHGVPGAALPASAMMRQSQQMENHVRKIPPSQRIQPVSPQARQWQAHRTPGAAIGQPAGFHPRRGPEPTATATMPPRGTAPGSAGPRMRSGGLQGTPPSVTPGTAGVAPETRGRRHQRTTTPTQEGMASRGPSPSQVTAPTERAQPGKRQQPGGWSRQKQAGPAAITPGKPAGRRQQPRYTPGTPGPRAAAPGQIQQPAQRTPTPQASPQVQPRQQQKNQQKQQQFRQRKSSPPDQSRGFFSGRRPMSRTQPGYQQSVPQPSQRMRQQPVPQARHQVRQQPRPQPQVRQRPRPQPQRQVRQQPRPQPQVRQQPRPQPRPQVRQQPRPQPRPQVRQQPRSQPQRQVRQQPRPQTRPQAQNRHQPQQHGRNKQVSEQN